MRIFVITLSVILVLTSDIYASGAFPLYDDSTILIGSNTTARKYDVGYNEIVDANSHTDPWIPENNTGILIPTSWLLPKVLDDGIIINLAGMRLYNFFSLKGLKYVSTYPIGIGVQGFNTPTGKFRITKKIKSPVWYVPDIIREANPELPAFVPDGPDNPLGGYWLQLSVSGYGIHGTNRPYGIGRKISHGCIRLYPEDIKTLFEFIKPGTTVRIINEPVKAGMYGNKVYIEIHRSERKDSELLRLSGKKTRQETPVEICRYSTYDTGS
jgi:L,D-transpeptidase ErfK/SrfK